MKTYNKLVRDNIPKIIKEAGKKCDTHTASDEEYTNMLEEKLKEELNEYMESKNLEELADIMEVIIALAKNSGYSEDELIHIRNDKYNARGGFDKKIILENVYE